MGLARRLGHDVERQIACAVICQTRLAVEPKMRMDARAPQVEIDHEGLVARFGEGLGEVDRGRGLAFLRDRARDEDHIPVLALASEEKARPQGPIGFGDDAFARGVVFGHDRETVRVQMPFDVVRRLQRIVEIVAQQDEPAAGQEPARK